MTAILIEAESFDNLGGWIIDQRSMTQVGSAYIMAHGMGVPVADAETVCQLAEPGKWTVWCRTRDWTAVWGRGTPAGKFQVKINGTALPVTLGTNGPEWAWQCAGTAQLEAGACRIALHDLTGFNGRCDALFLTNDSAEIPENTQEWRAQYQNTQIEDDPEFYDFAVAGGGFAGMCAALAAFRTGSKVVLINDREVLGGCNSSEIRVVLGGFSHVEPYPELGYTVDDLAPVFGLAGTRSGEYYEDERKTNAFFKFIAGGSRLMSGEAVIAVEKSPDDPSLITAFVTRNIRNGKMTRLRARVFADCTGDAIVARMMGAETMYGTESREQFKESLAFEKGSNQVMGHTITWYSRPESQPSPFPDIDWGLPFSDATAYYVRGGDWEWETGQFRDQADDAEYIRDYGLLAILSNWSWLKNHSARKAEWAHETLKWVSPIGGKRESYRVYGDYVLSQNDIESRTEHPDATGSMSWNIDLHFPDPENAAKFEEPFRSCAYHRGIEAPYPVPYRCLYARDVKNLFLGGRHISVSHVAFACVRVMRTLGVLGEVIGMAATLCRTQDALPREIGSRHFELLKEMMRKGVRIPPYHAWACSSHETYHFKDTGHLNPYSPDLDDQTRERIRKLNVSQLK